MSEGRVEGHVRPAQGASVWLLLGHKAGDNNQVLALAEQLAWPWVEKRIRYQSWELLSNRLLGTTLSGIDRHASSPLEPPWPDLVISSGRRNEPVARWIKRQSGDHTRIVHMGRPWAAPQAFDLVITTPQYAVPALPNVLTLSLPLHRLGKAALEQAALRWRDSFDHLPEPRTAVLLGGNSGAYVFSAEKGRRLGAMVNGLARSQGGSVLLTDSARTPEAALQAALAEIQVPVHCHRWGGARERNPYLAYLALADQFVVTADSMSMLSEACHAGKPVYLFSLEDGAGWWRRGYNYRFSALVHRLAMRCGPRRMRRDVGRIIAGMRAGGRVAWLGEEAPVPRVVEPLPDQRARAALAVAALFSR